MMKARLDAAFREEGGDRIHRAHTLLECFGELTNRGIAALENADLDLLEASLAARGRIVPVLDDLLSDAAEQAEGEPLAALLTHAGAVQKLDARLGVVLGAERQRVGREMELLDGEEAIRFAYGQTSPTEGRSINLTR